MLCLGDTRCYLYLTPAIRLMCISCIRPRALSPQRRAGREERQKVSQNKCVCVLDLHPYFVTYLKGLRRACSRSCKRTYTSSNGLAGDAGVRSWPEDSAGLIHCTGSSLARSSHFRRTLPITSVSVFFFFLSFSIRAIKMQRSAHFTVTLISHPHKGTRRE